MNFNLKIMNSINGVSLCTNTEKHDIISEEEYRKLLNDNLSPSKQIKQRIDYLEVFLRNIIRKEIEKYKKMK